MNAFSERARARRYLLGHTSEQENADIEARYLVDQDAIDELTLVEDDLIEGYLDERLTADERASFEQAFMTAPRRRARVETVRMLRRAAPSASRTGSAVKTANAADRASAPTAPATDAHAGPRATWRPWLALAASVLVVVGGASLWRTSRPSAPAAVAANPAGETLPPVGGTAPAAPPTVATPAPRVFAVALSAMAVRGGTDAPPLNIPAGTDRLRLDLELERGATAVVPTRAVLSTVGGSERWQSAIVVTGDNVTVDLPAAVVTPDDYLIALMAPDGAGGERTWMQYALRVR